MRYSKLALPLFLLSVLTMAACASGGSTGTTTTEPTRPAASLDNVPWTLTYLEVNGQAYPLVPFMPDIFA